MNSIVKIVGIALGVIVLFALDIAVAAFVSLIVAAIAMELWNVFCPYINMPLIGYWQMWSFIVFLYLIADTVRLKMFVNND